MFLGLQQTRRKSITVKIRVYSWGYSNISGDFKGGFIQESTLKTLFSLENVFYLFSFRVTKYFQATTYKGEKTVIRKDPCIIPGVTNISSHFGAVLIHEPFSKTLYSVENIF